MSLDTYANLKTEIESWMIRADMTATVDTLIDLFEAWASRNIRHRAMEGEATSPGTEYLELPDDFLDLRDIQWQGSPVVNLDYLTPAAADRFYPSGAAGTPKFYTIVGNQFRFMPPPDSLTDIRISYWKRIEALSGSNTTNWLLTAHPDAYLYGSLFHGLVWARDLTVAGYIRDGWSQVMAEIKKDGRQSAVGGSLVIRPA